MPSGIRTMAGQDTDARYVAGAGGAATGWRVGGADLNTRYAPRTSGPTETTGLRTSVGVDFDARFQKVASVPLSAAASPSPASNSYECVQIRPGPITCPTSTALSISTTVTASGGVGSIYTHSWSFLSGDSSIAISDASVPNPTWSAAVAANSSREAFWRDTVSDGTNTINVDVDVQLEYTRTIESGA